MPAPGSQLDAIAPEARNGLRPYADGMKGSYLGPKNDDEGIEAFLKSGQLPYKKYSREELPHAVAELLAAGKIIGLHQGRMEFGPRALGGRSIIGRSAFTADAGDDESQDQVS